MAETWYSPRSAQRWFSCNRCYGGSDNVLKWTGNQKKLRLLSMPARETWHGSCMHISGVPQINPCYVTSKGSTESFTVVLDTSGASLIETRSIHFANTEATEVKCVVFKKHDILEVYWSKIHAIHVQCKTNVCLQLSWRGKMLELYYTWLYASFPSEKTCSMGGTS